MNHSVGTTAEQSESAQTSAQPLSLGAVAYLNMLPFFADDPRVELYATPRLLNNSKSISNAYCSSLIAGLNAGKNPVSNRYGVFSSGPVQSVYIEPLIATDAHAEFWHRLEQLWAHRQPDPVAALSDSGAHGRVILRTCGASEQSVWMVRVLTALAGFRIEVMTDADPHPLAQAEKSPPEARLWIGDPALERRSYCKDVYRIDIGEVWNSHTGYKAWFAGWFAGSAYEDANQIELTRLLMNKTEGWAQRSEFSRWCATFKFLESQKSILLNSQSLQSTDVVNLSQEDQSWDLRDMLSDYFSALEFSIPAEEGDRLLTFYKSINDAIQKWENSTNPMALTTPSVSHGIHSTADVHRNLNQ